MWPELGASSDARLQEAAAFGRNFVLRRRKANFLLEIDSLGVNPLGCASELKSPRSPAKVLLPGVNRLTCSGGRRIVLFLLLLAAFSPFALQTLFGGGSKSPLSVLEKHLKCRRTLRHLKPPRRGDSESQNGLGWKGLQRSPSPNPKPSWLEPGGGPRAVSILLRALLSPLQGDGLSSSRD